MAVLSVRNVSKSFDDEKIINNIYTFNIDKILKCSEEWYLEAAERFDDSMSTEKNGISLMLKNMDKLGIVGGAIFVEDKAVAFTLGSPINSYVFNTFVEKALLEYSAAYTVINREFALWELSDFEYINREDDMGLEGLRKAKLSYKPVAFVKKYLCTPKVNI